MIDALFSAPNYLATKKMLDATVLRQEAIASNLGHLEMPNYKRVDVAPSFGAELRQALGSRSTEKINLLRPQLEVDLAASKVDYQDGRYVVRGEIVNKGKAPGTTRTLKLVFKKDNDVLGERAYALIEGPILPGARRPFSQVLDDPPAGTTDIVPAIE